MSAHPQGDGWDPGMLWDGGWGSAWASKTLILADCVTLGKCLYLSESQLL